MALVLFVLIGFVVGYKYQMTTKAYIIMGLVTITFLLIQLLDVLLADKSEITILPIVIGATFAVFMLIGSLSHKLIHQKSNTPN